MSIVIVSVLLLALLSSNILVVYASTSPQPTAAPSTEQPKPGTLIVITFENGTTKVVRSTSTNVLSVTGGYLVVDPSVVPNQPLPARTISQSVVNQFYTAIAIAIGITITEPPLTPIKSPSDCLPGTVFDPVNKECDPEQGECPDGEIRGRSGYCAVLPKDCPPGTSIDEDPICEPGFNQDCPIGTKLNEAKDGCEPIECGEGEILQGDDCMPGFAPCGPEWGNPCPGTEQPEPTPEPVAPQEPTEEPEPESQPEEGNLDQNTDEGDGGGDNQEDGGDSNGGGGAEENGGSEGGGGGGVEEG